MGLHRPKILVVGSFMMDLIAMTSRAPSSGETVLGHSFHTAPGGKGANQAVQCARLGADVTMVGRVGQDSFGEMMIETAREAGVDVSHVSIDHETASGVGHILLECEENQTRNRITVIPGANHTIRDEEIEWLKEGIAQYDMVMLQLEIPMSVNMKVASYAKASGVPVMLNPAPAASLPKELLSCITYLSPNEHEAKLLAGIEISAGGGRISQKETEQVLRWSEENGIGHVIITLGENGAVISDGKMVRNVPCVSIDPVRDPTAAGDSFVASFCTGVCMGMSHLQAMKFASYAAAITVNKMGAMPSLPTMEQVRELMNERKESDFPLEFLRGTAEVKK